MSDHLQNVIMIAVITGDPVFCPVLKNMSYNISFDGENLKSLVKKSKNIAIVCAERGVDSVASGIVLSKYIKRIYNKSATLFYTGNISMLPEELISITEIEGDFVKRTLRITLDFAESSVSSVDYYKNKEKSELILDINSAGVDFNVDRIKYNFIGADFDLIVVIGSSSLSSLGNIYSENISIFENAKVINIDTSLNNKPYGIINIVDPKEESLSGLMLKLLLNLDFVIDKNLSKILLLGLSE